MKEGQNLNFAIQACLIAGMQTALVEQVKELRESNYSNEASENEIQKTMIDELENSVELGVAQNKFVQSAECNIFDNKSILIKIYIADSIDIRKMRVDSPNMDMGIRGMCLYALSSYIWAISIYPSIEDLTLQICNSTALQCTMRCDRSLISMSNYDIINNPLQGRQLVESLITKMLSTMKPVVGSHLVHGRLVPIENIY